MNVTLSLHVAVLYSAQRYISLAASLKIVHDSSH
jgi:hypothetical protein